MIIEEELKDEPKIGDINPEALEAVFAEENDSVGEEEDVVVMIQTEDEDANDLDIAFYDDEDQW